MDVYLAELVARCRAILGPSLQGAYLYGSAAQGEMAQLSDIDVLLVIETPLSERQNADLAAQLNHAALPVPASGLELMAVLSQTALRPPLEPRVAFALSTGENWATEIQTGIDYEDVLLDTAIARESGRALLGPPPRDAFGAVERSRLLRLVVQALEWHRPRLLDLHHDPLGQNSILNAARAWRYAVTGGLASKRQGGLWAIEQGIDLPLIETALAIREGRERLPPAPQDIDRFLASVIEICRAARA